MTLSKTVLILQGYMIYIRSSSHSAELLHCVKRQLYLWTLHDVVDLKFESFSSQNDPHNILPFTPEKVAVNGAAPDLG